MNKVVEERLPDLIRMPSEQPGELEIKRALLGIEAQARLGDQVIHQEVI